MLVFVPPTFIRSASEMIGLLQLKRRRRRRNMSSFLQIFWTGMAGFQIYEMRIPI